MTNEHIPCLTKIRATYSSFSEKEKMVADYILENSQEMIHATINQVAEDLGIAEATVFRFCKRLGFSGFQAMKIALASEVVTPIQDIHETIQEEDDEKAITEKVFKSNIRTLEDTLHVIESDHYKKAVHAIVNARRVEFYGNGGSGIIALDAHHKFLRTGIPTAAYQDSHFQVMSASQLTKEDVVVLISHSGTNRDILQVLDVAEEHGATTICITTLAKSPLSRQVDIPLYTVSKETEYRSEALASRLAQLSIIDALYVNVSIQRKEQMKDSLQRMRKAISNKRI
ncbi:MULTISPECIES: MurR/RpiR family transcriptional regulator [Alkalihalophilus]|uniref:RpiR transcriptional regulator n=1 Tax=Alkalihalophilus pseudofirmus (strain ATCC BAA-2126 / JCM 17055 / OF4) TaxID=398511 RepID=D3FUA1_ALKPO|nr:MULTISPECIES: MurR/RpiR family transcriptional regulator [Alkalihalophilus]ADC48303.1 RpiR transcriptional regulator [Alkalihalophilus pseudofirmus OF4]MEC2072915.1 MurR/RpiR family transcriptional regulator [Alkalihalophilus marmarensis]MED1602096.1 MurR/RpiR family transcriptional regulator [Alkalihalophilus marmarensis]